MLVLTKTDRLRTLREQIEEWIDAGAQLTWMIDPDIRSVEIYWPKSPVERLEKPDRLEADGPLIGFVLELPLVWNPLGN